MSVFWIPVVAIAFGISIGMLGLWTDHKRRAQLLEHQHRERMAAIERGMPLPPTKAEGTIVAEAKAPDPARSLRSGVLLLTIGIILYFAIETAGGHEGALFGLVPAAVGIANLAYAFVLFRRAARPPAGKSNDDLPPA